MTAEPEHQGPAVAAGGGEPDDCPYIGLRPYSENEQALFFGRDRDTQFLVDKILSGPLTLMYGTSGVGKSSLLRARVVPDLRQPAVAGALVVYIFDCWAEPDVEAAIKRTIERKIAEVAKPDGLAVPELTAPLLDWARTVNEALGRPLVLILDQFEQFLLHRAGFLDPLRRELASLVRARADVYVVLALREEYLASLEVFTHDIVNIYESTFRLEHLGEDGARDAIVRPAQARGVTVEPDLVDALIRDLRATVFERPLEQVGAALGEANIELPILQILCQQLWKHRDPQSPDRMTAELYRRMDGRDGIVRGYLADLTRELGVSEQDDAAMVLDWLAPRSGLKATFSIDQLAKLTGLPPQRVGRLLSHFEDKWVLRETAGERFELYHDAFTKVLGQWIGPRLAERSRRQRRVRNWRIAGAVGVAGVALLALAGIRNWMAMPDPDAACTTEARGDEASKGVQLAYRTGLDDVLLKCRWAAHNTALRKAGLAVILPMRLSPGADESQASDTVTMRLPGKPAENVAVKVPARLSERHFYDRLPEPFRSLSSPVAFATSLGDWAELADMASLPPWAYYPLRLLGYYPRPAEEVVVTAALRQLLSDPRLTLTQPVVDYLLARAFKASPQTVNEALTIQGDRKKVRDIVRAVVAQSGNNIGLVYTNFDRMLEAMAGSDAAGASAPDVARRILADIQSPSTQLPQQIVLRGSKPVDFGEDPDKLKDYESALTDEYALRASELPQAPTRQPRVELGRELIPCVADEQRNLNKEVLDLLNSRRKTYDDQFDIDLPGVRFAAGPAMPPRAFSIELADKIYGPITVGEGNCAAAIVDGVFARVLASGLFRTTDEGILEALGELPTDQAKWLRDRVSLTDLKLLVRAIAATDGNQVDVLPDVARGLSEGRTARDLPLLLRSLVFWREACAMPGTLDHFSSACLIDGLRRTQAARFATRPAKPADQPAIEAEVRLGITELLGFVSGGPAAAAEAFGEALQRDDEAARQAFLGELPTAADLMDIKGACSLEPGDVLDADPLGEDKRKTVAEAVASDRWGDLAQFAVPLQLCVLRDDLSIGAPEAAQSLDRLLLQSDATLSKWSTTEIYTLAVLALRGHRSELYRRDENFAPTKAAIAKAISQAFERWGQDDDADAAEAALMEVVDVCHAAAGPHWCLNVLSAGLQRFGKPTWYMLADMAIPLAQQGSEEDARLAQYLFDQAEHARGSSRADISARGEWLSYGRALAELSLVQAGAEDDSNLQGIEYRLGHLDRELKRVREEDRNWPPVTVSLLQAADLAHHPDVADRLLNEQPKGDTGFAEWRFVLLVRGGRLAEAMDALQHVDDPEQSDMMFLRALAAFLGGTQDAPSILKKSAEQHGQNEAYTRLLLSIVLVRQGDQEAARTVLKEGLTGIDMATSPDRLQDGDMTPWHEMLLKYYLNGGKEEDFQRLRGTIGDAQSFGKSVLVHTGQSRVDFLTELYFYDALLQSVSGDPETRTQRERDELGKVVDAGGVMMLENAMARYLLTTLGPAR